MWLTGSQRLAHSAVPGAVGREAAAEAGGESVAHWQLAQVFHELHSEARLFRKENWL